MTDQSDCNGMADVPEAPRPQKQEVQGVDWTGVTDEMAEAILKQGETFLKAQLDTSLASDRRALTMGSMFASVSTAILGVGVAHFDRTQNLALLLANITTAALMMTGAIYGFWAARPITVYAPGGHPRTWWPYRNGSLAALRGGESENQQMYIEHNERCMGRNAAALSLGSRFVVAAPIVGFVVWCLSHYLSP